MKFCYHLCLTAFFLVFVSSSLLTSCTDEEPDSDPSFKLSFSTDTIVFDTVFTTIGSYTQSLKVYNPNKSKVVISKISLIGSTDAYKINIDGKPATSATDVELDSGDSLFIFINVTIDPVNQNLPLVVTGQIAFQTNGNLQAVELVAWGQDAYYHTPDHFPANFPAYSVVQGEVTWHSDKPHVVYGWLVVDSASVLSINEGAKVYFHNQGMLMVYRDGVLLVQGSADNPVLFRNDRLDAFYRDLPGQWNGLWISEGADQCVVNHAVIENATLAIQVDNPDDFAMPQLLISNTQIRNMSLGGIAGNATWIEGVNLAISGCGSYALALNGGQYSFIHASVGNLWSSSVRNLPSVVVKNYFVSNNEVVRVEPTNVFFGNCVVFGNQEDELLIDSHPDVGTFTFLFDHCFLKTTRNIISDPSFVNVTANVDPLFVDAANYNLHPDTLSPLVNSGVDMGVPADLEGFSRTEMPDVGAYEFH